MTDHRSPSMTPPAIARLAAAWVVASAALVATTAGAFTAVEAWARPVFAAQRRESSKADVQVGPVVGSVELSDGLVVKQEFDARHDGLAAVRLRMVTWARLPDDYECIWSLIEHSPDGRSRRMIRRGSFPTAAARDWEYVDLAFAPVSDSFAVRYTLRIRCADGRPAHPVGLPLYTPRGVYQSGVRVGRRQPVIVGTGTGAHAQAAVPVIPEPSTLDLQPVYTAERG